MATIDNVLKRLLPSGTGNRSTASWKSCPIWPPDLFAVVATLVEQSGCYADPPFTSPWHSSRFIFDTAGQSEIVSLGRSWIDAGAVPDDVQALWNTLINNKKRIITDRGPRTSSWKEAAVQLLLIADEASVGLGFPVSEAPVPSLFGELVLESHLELLKGQTPTLPYVPRSLCLLVPPTEVCVQPKTNTPKVGCTLRSLTHNLALLPAEGVVTTTWRFAHPAAQTANELNLLLVPFPFRIDDKAFAPEPGPSEQRHRFFKVDPGQWLATGAAGTPIGPDAFAAFLIDLVEACDGPVHGVVLPELALPEEFADQLAPILASRCPKLEFLISGVSHSDYSGPRNRAATYRFHDGRMLQSSKQSKHHRWSLNRSQIERYQLERRLDPGKIWWERIEMAERACDFDLLRQGASFAVLVCEDLARFDPVMPVINAVGPNLVIALLMDGPQLAVRWPGRYATVLADDPGSSVLTLTSLGMIRRSNGADEDGQREIALWKEVDGQPHPIVLPPDCHAVMLKLLGNPEQQITLDGRDDQYGAIVFRRLSEHGVVSRKPNAHIVI